MTLYKKPMCKIELKELSTNTGDLCWCRTQPGDFGPENCQPRCVVALRQVF